jgi:hypothetical protein
MIRQLDQCCWYVDREVDCERGEAHFLTEAEALADERAAAEVDERAPRTVRRTPAGCWVVDCDRCRLALDDEDVGELHYSDQGQLTAQLDAASWRVVSGGWLCCPRCAAARPALSQVAHVSVPLHRGGPRREVVAGEATACAQLVITTGHGDPVLTHRPTGTCLPTQGWTADVGVLHRVAELLAGLDWSSPDPAHYATGYAEPLVAALDQATREHTETLLAPASKEHQS